MLMEEFSPHRFIGSLAHTPSTERFLAQAEDTWFLEMLKRTGVCF
jgi:hypothetical protein